MNDHLHLSHDEFIEALDLALGGPRRAHLERCVECRVSLAQLEATMADVASSPVPEPSPLFWDHLRARIREATMAVPSPAPWWQGRWRSLVAATAAVVLVVVAASGIIMPAPVVPAGMSTARLSDTPGDLSVVEDGSWQAVGDLAAALSSDDVQLVVAAGPMASSAMTDVVTALTPREREAFVKLLNVEMDRGDFGGAH